MRYATVDITTNLVENVIVLQGFEYGPGEGLILVSIEDVPACEVGWIYDPNTGALTAPESTPPPVPTSVTPLQIRKALRRVGLKPTVDVFVATLDEETREEWEYALSIERGNTTLVSAATAMGMAEAQVDDLFRLAASLI